MAVGCGACSDWLTVQPETVVLKEDACKSDEGLRQLLSGMYLSLKTVYSPEGRLGGGDGIAEGLACSWYPNGERINAFAEGNYNHTDVKDMLNYTFMNLYNTIAMANDLIECAPQYRSQLTDSVYNIAMGEAYGIRAFCHLDLIRLWGPMPSHVDAGKTYLPYVTVNDVNPYEYLPYEDYMNLLLADLDSAEHFLQADPILDRSYDSFDASSEAWGYRKSRMNYYAVLGLQARARLWYGDTEEAVEYARMVINAQNPDGTPKVRLMTLEEDGIELIPGVWSVGDPSAYSEHLFGIKCEDYTYATGGWGNASGAFNVLNPVGMAKITAIQQDLFENNLNDFRYKYIWTVQTSPLPVDELNKATFKKYNGFYISDENTCQMNFPILRLSELYLIMIECAPLAEANAAWEEFCDARELEYAPLTDANRQERVGKEFLKEFIGEGQNFYSYKRLGATQRIFIDTPITEDQYVLPIPENEHLN